MLLDSNAKRTLVAAAKAAVTKAFLTKENGVRYGAAVLVESGEIFSAGQYSSFNHSTNVHAEQAAIIAATMNGFPDVLALAVASTGGGAITRPCGICRQTMLEHATRTGRDFIVLMANQIDGWEEQTVSDLLPYAWTHASKAEPKSQIARTCDPSGGIPWQAGLALKSGDHVRLHNGAIAVVWDPAPWADMVLIKIKYRQLADGTWIKLPSALAEPTLYERELYEFDGLSSVPCGAPVACVHNNDIIGVFSALPRPDLPPILARCLKDSDISLDQVFLGGSRSTGMNQRNSDVDLVLRVHASQANSLRGHLTRALIRGTIQIPPNSGTWKILEMVFPGGKSAVLKKEIFAETIQENEQSYSLMLCPFDPELPTHGKNSIFHGHTALEGTVVDATRSFYKRSSFTLKQDNGKNCQVISYHKVANLVSEGDRLALRGWMVEDNGNHILLQFNLRRDNIVWFPADYKNHTL